MTPAQTRVFNAVRDLAAERGHPPTIAEVARFLGVTVPAVSQHANNMAAAGTILDIARGRRRRQRAEKPESPKRYGGIGMRFGANPDDDGATIDEILIAIRGCTIGIDHADGDPRDIAVMTARIRTLVAKLNGRLITKENDR